MKRYKQITWYKKPTFLYHFFNIPKYGIQYFIHKKNDKDFNEYMDKMRMIQELRKQTLYYDELGGNVSDRRATFRSWYKYDERSIYVKCKFYRKATRKDYDNFWDSVDFHCDTSTKIRKEKGYGFFQIVLNFKPLYEYECTREYVSIGTVAKGLERWYWFKQPHALISGPTGSGKSVFMKYLLSGIQFAKHRIWLADGKKVDYAKTKNSFYRYAANGKDKAAIINLISEFRAAMHKRLDEMTDTTTGSIESIEHSEKFNPEFLIIDELLMILDTCSKDEKTKIIDDLSDILFTGRAPGFIVIVTMQRPDADAIKGRLREQFALRVAFGNQSADGFKMMFGDLKIDKLRVGHAWYSLGEDLDIMKVPYYKAIDTPDYDNEIENTNIETVQEVLKEKSE